jgi:hypothetical protein
MREKRNKGCDAGKNPCACEADTDLKPHPTGETNTISCIASSPRPDQEPFEPAGFERYRFVEDFVDTAAGKVPKVKPYMDRRDVFGTFLTRLGIGRNNYKIAPGLYCVGTPGPDSPVLVTANFKLSFDTLRKELVSLDVWILVLDTRGVNVWCAAGKGTFSTTEVVRWVNLTDLFRVVNHRELILPQLAATGVSGRLVKKECDFKVIWGPVRARDIKYFLKAGMKAEALMRRVTFSLAERLILVPVELSLVLKPTLFVLLAVFLLSGIGTDVFSVGAAWSRGIMAISAYAGGIFAGAVAAPALLPWIPGRAFSFKGTVTGLVAGVVIALAFWESIRAWEALALFLLTITTSSYLAMNFTGSTPFTSPSGVEKEMRRAIPVQAMTLLFSAFAWIGSAFSG